MNMIKKQTAGIYVTAVAFILGIVSLIVYAVSVNHAGYFQNASIPVATRNMWIGLVVLCLAIVLDQLDIKGVANRIIAICSDILRVFAPVLFIAALMEILSERIEGFAFIYFSNEEVLHEVQTAENMASTHLVIANLVLLGVAAIVAIVAAFMKFRKEK